MEELQSQISNNTTLQLYYQNLLRWVIGRRGRRYNSTCNFFPDSVLKYIPLMSNCPLSIRSCFLQFQKIQSDNLRKAIFQWECHLYQPCDRAAGCKIGLVIQFSACKFNIIQVLQVQNCDHCHLPSSQALCPFPHSIRNVNSSNYPHQIKSTMEFAVLFL